MTLNSVEISTTASFSTLDVNANLYVNVFFHHGPNEENETKQPYTLRCGHLNVNAQWNILHIFMYPLQFKCTNLGHADVWHCDVLTLRFIIGNQVRGFRRKHHPFTNHISRNTLVVRDTIVIRLFSIFQ